MLVKCFHGFWIYEFTIFLWFFFFAIKIQFFYWAKTVYFHKKNFAENKTFFCENKFWIRENISQTSKLQSFLTFFFNFVSQNWNLLFKIRHGFIALEAFWALKKETSPLLGSGYLFLPHVAFDLLLEGPTYLLTLLRRRRLWMVPYGLNEGLKNIFSSRDKQHLRKHTRWH